MSYSNQKAGQLRSFGFRSHSPHSESISTTSITTCTSQLSSVTMLQVDGQVGILSSNYGSEN